MFLWYNWLLLFWVVLFVVRFAVVVGFGYGGCYSGLGFIGNCRLSSGCCAGGLVYLVVCFSFLFSWFCCSLGLRFVIGGFDGTGLFVWRTFVGGMGLHVAGLLCIGGLLGVI